jgi:hypothetical protein
VTGNDGRPMSICISLNTWPQLTTPDEFLKKTHIVSEIREVDEGFCQTNRLVRHWHALDRLTGYLIEMVDF